MGEIADGREGLADAVYDSIERTLGTRLGGLWFDEKGLSVAVVDANDEDVERIQSLVPPRFRPSIISVTWSSEQLEAFLSKLDRIIQTLEPKGFVIAYGVDPKGNCLFVQAANGVSPLEAAILPRFPAGLVRFDFAPGSGYRPA